MRTKGIAASKGHDGIQAAVYTRWHQLSVPLAFALAAGGFMLVVFNRGPVLWAVIVALAGLLTPPLVAFKGFPTRNRITVTPDGLVFSRRAPVAFADLTRWGTDDFLKLVRPGYPTLLVSPVDAPNRERLLREFQAALQAWQKRQPAGTEAARRTNFYGSTGARWVGAVITALGAGAALMALNLHEPSVPLAIVGGLGALFGLAMLMGRRV